MTCFSPVHRLATGRNSAILLGFFIVASLLWFRLGPAAALTAGNRALLDTRTGYSTTELYETIASYGPQGRQAYVLFLIGDFFYAPLFAVTFLLLLAFGLKQLQWNEGPLGWLLTVPVAGGLLDWLEDGILLTLMLRYPTRLDALARFPPVVTAVKLGLVNLSFLLLLAVLLLAVARRLGQRPGRGAGR